MMQTATVARDAQDDVLVLCALMDGGHLGDARPIEARRLAGRLGWQVDRVVQSLDALRGSVRGTPRLGYWLDQDATAHPLVGRRCLLKEAPSGQPGTVLGFAAGGALVIELRRRHAAPKVVVRSLTQVIVLPHELVSKLAA